MLLSIRKIYNNKNRLRRIKRLMKSYRNEYKRKRMHEWLYNGVKYKRVRGWQRSKQRRRKNINIRRLHSLRRTCNSIKKAKRLLLKPQRFIRLM